MHKSSRGKESSISSSKGYDLYGESAFKRKTTLEKEWSEVDDKIAC